MIRLVLFFILVLALGFGFSWIADRPGDVALQWQGTTYETSLMVVVAAVVALIAAVMVTWAVIRIVLNSPQIMRRFWTNRKRDRGYDALSRGLIAAGAGDPALARRNTKESQKLLGNVPLVGLLDAQTALLEGKREEAKTLFEGMLEEDDTRLVALRGLYLEAEKQNAGEAARHYAEEAHKEAPALGWAGNAILRYRALDGDWDGALKALEANKSAGLIEKQTARRHRAVLLTAEAYAAEPADPSRAAKLAREAHKLAPELVPAAVIGAKALMRNNDIGRAAGLLESVWKKDPHPEIAQAYVDLRIGDSAQDRLKRARKLAAMRSNHPEGNIAIAETAIEAQDWDAAREAMKPVLLSRPTERACLIMADIEEGQYGDKGRMRDWLSRAVRAPKDAAWTADGQVSEQWLPISPVSGRIDAFEWKVPLEQIGAPSSPTLEASDLEDLATSRPAEPEPPENDGVSGMIALAAGAGAATAPVEAEASPEPETQSTEAETIEPDASETPSIEVDGAEMVEEVVAREETATAAEASTVGENSGETESLAGGVEDAEVIAENEPETGNGVGEAGSSETAKAEESAVDSRVSDDGVSVISVESQKAGPEDRMVKPVLEHRPDDPGVSENEPDEAPKKRFGLF